MRDPAKQTDSRESSMPEPQAQLGPDESSSVVCQPSSLSLCRQMNPIRISQALLHSPSEEVLRDCYRDLIIAHFQRQREGAILQRPSRVGDIFSCLPTHTKAFIRRPDTTILMWFHFLTLASVRFCPAAGCTGCTIRMEQETTHIRMPSRRCIP